MRDAQPLERAVGIEYYVSDTDGVGGELRADPEHFRVQEIERFESEPADADPGDYPWLILRATLRNRDTNDFARELSNRAGISRERVSWAGTKDKHARTTQLFSVRGIDPTAVPEVSGAEIEVVGRAGRGLQFGDLAGNEFHVVVADPDAPGNADAITGDLRDFAGVEDHDDETAEGTQTVAVPNVFGQQRFGSYRPVTHEVGLAVIDGSWEDAVMAYLGNPTDAEPADTQDARAYVQETRDWEGALERFPNRLRYERTMLHELAANGGESAADFRDALETFPSNLQRLFVNAAQSYAFNLILSRRLEADLPFHEPVAGDVVCFADRDAPTGLALPDTDRIQDVTASRVDVIARHCERGRAFVTAPLVGTETGLADGTPGEIERAVLDDLGVAPGDFDLPGEFHSTGTRRAILVRTDLAVDTEPLAFDFALPKGSYATVLLREYLKGSPLDL